MSQGNPDRADRPEHFKSTTLVLTIAAFVLASGGCEVPNPSFDVPETKVVELRGQKWKSTSTFDLGDVRLPMPQESAADLRDVNDESHRLLLITFPTNNSDPMQRRWYEVEQIQVDGKWLGTA